MQSGHLISTPWICGVSCEAIPHLTNYLCDEAVDVKRVLIQHVFETHSFWSRQIHFHLDNWGTQQEYHHDVRGFIINAITAIFILPMWPVMKGLCKSIQMSLMLTIQSFQLIDLLKQQFCVTKVSCLSDLIDAVNIWHGSWTYIYWF